MKRKPPDNFPGFTSHYYPVLLNFSQEQLAGIGAVAVTYNAAEELIDDLVRIGWRLDVAAKEILTRIGGLDGKIHLAKYSCNFWVMPDEMKKAISDTLGDGDFGLLKKYRDGVIHARILDFEQSVGIVVERRNRPSHVLLTKEALNGLATRLEIITNELEALLLAYREIKLMAPLADGDPEKARCEALYQDAMVQFQRHRTQRLSLPPLPEFPEAPGPKKGPTRLILGPDGPPPPNE